MKEGQEFEGAILLFISFVLGQWLEEDADSRAIPTVTNLIVELETEAIGVFVTLCVEKLTKFMNLQSEKIRQSWRCTIRLPSV